MALHGDITIEQANAWIAALRSENYEQCRGVLASTVATKSFCCLGVLCDVMGIDNHGDDGAYHKVYRLIGRNVASELMMRNDRNRENFLTIADAIEVKLKETTREA